MGAPDWVMQLVRDLKDILGLWSYSVGVRMTDAPNGDENNLGFSEVTSRYRSITLCLNASIEDDENGRKVVIHEMIHGAHGAIDTMLQALGTFDRPETIEVYKEVYEPFVCQMTDAIYRILYGENTWESSRKKKKPQRRSNRPKQKT